MSARLRGRVVSGSLFGCFRAAAVASRRRPLERDQDEDWAAHRGLHLAGRTGELSAERGRRKQGHRRSGCNAGALTDIDDAELQPYVDEAATLSGGAPYELKFDEAFEPTSATREVDAIRVLRRGQADVYQCQDRGHGRQECRRCEALPLPPTVRNAERWADAQSICRVTRTYTEGGAEKSEVRYFLSSLPAQAKRLATGVRGHWGIENGLHWVLDMTFAEDRSRARKGNAQENLALLRRWALSVLRQDTTITGSVEKKRLQAGWNMDNLENLLHLF